MENQATSDTGNLPEEKKSVGTSVMVGVVFAISVAVLAFPSLLPDFIPVVGALDEVAATAMIISCLAYFGFDVRAFVDKAKKHKEAKGDVIDV